MQESCTAVLQQYTQRCPAGNPQPSEQDLSGWAASLRQEALGAAAALRRAVEAVRAQTDAEAAGTPDSLEEPSLAPAGDAAVAAAVQQVMQGVQAAEAALRAAPMDAACEQALRECSARLVQLLGSGIMA